MHPPSPSETKSNSLVAYSIAVAKFAVQLKLFAFEIKQNKNYAIKKRLFKAV